MFLEPTVPRARTAPSTLLVLALALFAMLVSLSPAAAQQLGPPIDPGRRLELALRHLDQSARLLYVTAHPDDEDSGLLARLHFGDGIRVRLLTLTRGEGGQNEIGTELFDALGILRSRELEGSAEWLGNEQRFSRAFEFGYSFSVEETFALWDEERMLRDIVREIREFRPDVILTMQPDGDGGGQHHQASAQLTASAFDIAATDRWPELGPAHTTSRLFHQLWRDDGGPVHLDLDLGVYDPVLGASYEEYGLRARETHQCQGMAQLHEPLTEDRSRWRWIRSAPGDASVPGEADDTPRELSGFCEGLPVRIGDSPDLRSRALSERIELVRTAFREGDDESGTQGLLELLGPSGREREGTGHLEKIEGRQTDDLRVRAAAALGAACGLTIHARSDSRYAAAGDTVRCQVRAAATRPIRLRIEALLPRTAGNGDDPGVPALDLIPNVAGQVDLEFRLGENTLPTLPHPAPRPGLDEELPAGSFGAPRWNPFRIRPTLLLGNREIELESLPILHQEVDPEHPRVLFADLHVVPEPSVRPLVGRIPLLAEPGPSSAADGIGTGTDPAPPRPTANCTWLVSSLRGGPVEITLTLPEGWTADPPTQRIELRPENEVPVTFSLRAGGDSNDPAASPEATIQATVLHLDSGKTSRQGYQRVEYDHVRPGALLVPAVCTVVSIPCASVPGLRIGYVDGSGDQTLSAIERLGYHPTRLDGTALLQGDLDLYDVIVTGVRAYKVREDLAAAQPRLLDWTRRGGTLLVQYNKFEFNAGMEQSSPFAPFPETLVGRRRVTVEESPVIVNQPDHPVFHRPNEIAAADWEGWVQERGLYFLDFEDDRYIDLLTLEDPWPYNAGPKGGALVDAPLGDGHWVYIGVGLFRQLPAAVPGAYRLLANLIALGTKEAP